MFKKKNLKFNNYRKPDQFGKLLGYSPANLDFKKKTAVIQLKITKKHLSPAGKVHGGVISALFDSTCGAAVFTTLNPEDFASTVELKVNYFSPLHVGDLLVCKASILNRGNRLCAVQANLTLQNKKKVLAHATGTFYVVSSKK